MKLKSFGCSFIFGSELHDDGYAQIKATASQFTWPALLAKHLGYTYECYAQPGSGNQRICEQILNQIATGEPAVYVVGWTWIERFDYIEKDSDRWRTITAMDTSDIADYYYKNMHSQYHDKLSSLSYITLALHELEKNNCKFLMTHMDDLLWETKYHLSAAMQLMQQKLLPHLYNFDGDNFLEWSRKQDFPIGSRGKHPLEQAHQAAADHARHHWIDRLI